MINQETVNAASIASRFINNTNRHVFLTGKAGTGKTTFLKTIEQTSHKSPVIAAPTGIAAINAGGVTLHSLFQLPFGSFIPESDFPYQPDSQVQINTPKTLMSNFKINRVKRTLIQEMELLIIDEVSMLRADLLDAIDVVLKTIRRQKQKPFGGVQILFIGDLLQLPPVVKRDEWNILSKYYKSAYFFESKALQASKPIYIELEKIFRQSDQTFISILNNLRNNQTTREDIRKLNQHYQTSINPKDAKGRVFITTHNRKADAINKQSLQKLPGKSYYFDAEVKGDFKEYLYPVDYTLELKTGAQVMFIKNDYSGEQRYFNGKIGEVTEIDDEWGIIVKFNDGSPDTTVERYTWENKRYTIDKDTDEIIEKKEGSFSHFPIKLAWAITVHKSQGLTFDKAIIDVSEAFAPGQVYVALSRLTSLNGLILNAPLKEKGLEPDEAIINFTCEKEDPVKLNEHLSVASWDYLWDMVMQAFDFSPLTASLKYHLNSYDKNAKKSAKQQHIGWAKNIHDKFIPVRELADKFLMQLKKYSLSDQDDLLVYLKDRLGAADNYFQPTLESLSKSILNHIALMEEEVGVKNYINELKELESRVFKQLKMIKKAGAIVTSALENKEISREDIKEQQIMKDRRKKMSGQGNRKIKNSKNRKDYQDQKKWKAKKDSGSEKQNSTDSYPQNEHGPVDYDNPSEELSVSAGQANDKSKKTNTKEISYQLFTDGKSIEEIARERSLAESTIEGHLAHFVGLGELDIEQFVEKYKIHAISTVSKKLDTTKFKAIKQALGDEFTYSDIRFVMAHKSYKAND